ncbi:carcinoembryonic antigen-related cell adhesion molecule 5-like [Acipenser ruthenus]|uniref:carcinoembryonic antigen-related cell adhesion molecule 5-like n=1 Tax=Acipenser ruthenus TaxID=7906 RepID=UPI002740937E|nr:carcinoembryonic antigen-related cell adhesion molecule 5-like [Acipenser ruthenus]
MCQGGTVQIRGTTGARYTLSPVTQSHSGQYQCEAQRGDPPRSSQRSDPVTLTVSEGRPKPALTREPAGEIFEGDTVTLSCVVEGGSGGWRYLWYKDRQGAPVYQTDSSSGTGAGYTISAAALSHSGEYWCGAGRGRNTSYSQYSDPIWVNVTALFSRVTLTASPGATVKEGEALNLTCEAAVNKTPRPELHYTIVRDGEPVTNSTDSALYSIASTEKSHTGSYTCAVESQGVKKSSQELQIELQSKITNPS